MPEIIQPFPDFLRILQGSGDGSDFPGAEVTQVIGGVSTGRAFTSANQRRVSMILGSLSTAELVKFETWIKNISGGAFSLVSTDFMNHHALPLAGEADGTRTTFRAPIYVGSMSLASDHFTVTKDGIPVDPTDFTVHQVANVMTEAESYPDDAANYNQSGCTAATEARVSRVLDTCLEVTPTLGSKPHLYTKTGITVSGTEVLTGVVGFLPTCTTSRDFQAPFTWWLGAAFAGIAGSNRVTTKEDGWTVIANTQTVPGGATVDTARLGIRVDDTTTTEVYYAGAYAINRGDLEDWTLPSQSPVSIEFNTAPAAGSTLKISGDGWRWSKMILDSQPSYQVLPGGRTSQINLNAIESME